MGKRERTGRIKFNEYMHGMYIRSDRIQDETPLNIGTYFNIKMKYHKYWCD